MALVDALAARGDGSDGRVVMLASTIGPIDAGIVGALEDGFHRRGQPKAAAALARIAAPGAPFVTRGDRSGTHVKEEEIWLVSDEAQRIIQGFGVERYGAPLFFPNADAWRTKRPSG